MGEGGHTSTIAKQRLPSKVAANTVKLYQVIVGGLIDQTGQNWSKWSALVKSVKTDQSGLCWSNSSSLFKMVKTGQKVSALVKVVKMVDAGQTGRN